MPPSLLLLDIHSNHLDADAGGTDLSVASMMTYLDASFNLLHGAPPSIPPSLRYAFLQHNRLNASFETLDAGYYASPQSQLRELDLSFNALSSWKGLPDFGLPRAVALLLSDNILSGPVPNVDACPLLLKLSLARNRLTGAAPIFLANSSLLSVDLAENFLSGGLEGMRLPAPLRALNLSSNNFTGSLQRD